MIVYEMESDCVGCPQGCINCGRKYKRPFLTGLYCDYCEEEVDVLYDDGNGNHSCLDCVLKDYNEINEDNYGEFIDI